MTTTKNLLVELFVEELPPKSLKKLGDSFAEVLAASLKSQGLAASDVAVIAYASPRRLAVHVSHVAIQAADKSVSQKLMPVAVGLDAKGQATPALLKKLASLGADASVVPQLKRAMDGKAEVLFFDSEVKGVTLVEGLQKALDESIAKLPIAKVMTYQLDDGWSSVSFVRPAHGLVALHGAEIVPVSALGLQAGRKTEGHRFEASMAKIALKDADSYAQQLETEGAVIASYEKRCLIIIRQLREQAKLLKSRLEVEPRAFLSDEEAEVILGDDVLIQEVTALVERPNVLVGQFEAEYLAVPQECLILTMKANQKYFPLLDANGGLTNKFLIVSNIHPDDPGLVIVGNERVIRPRLADAKFFFDKDRKQTLASRVEKLANVVYHNKLGTQLQRIERIVTLSSTIARMLGVGKANAERAAFLSKADLLTDMVGEFPELQGIMGRYYALHDGEKPEVADAIEAHYRPRFAGDDLPEGHIACALSLADKLETLVGIYGIGQVPTGDKDPFGLRRHGLGILRILIETPLDLPMGALLKTAAENFPAGMLNSEVEKDVEAFMRDRLRSYLRERDFEVSHIEAVLYLLNGRLHEALPRLEAVRAFAALPEAAVLAAANKRVGNILKKADTNSALRQAQGERFEVNPELLQEPAEQALHQALNQIAPKADAAFNAGDYTGSLQALAALRKPVDAFFDKVMVNVENMEVRANRLALLAQLHQAMNRVADISKLAS